MLINNFPSLQPFFLEHLDEAGIDVILIICQHGFPFACTAGLFESILSI